MWLSLRDAFFGLTGAPGRFVVASLAWMLVAAVPVLAGVAYAPAYLVGALLVPVSCGLIRMAAHAARDQPVRLSQLRDGATHRPWRHLLLGAGQAGVFAMALFNLGAGLSGAGLVAVMVTVVAANVAFATYLVALAVWPILLDPRRQDVRLGAALRLALAVIAARPLAMVALALIVGAAVAATVQTIVLGLFLPAFGALLAAHHVLPVADALEGRALSPDGRDQGLDATRPERPPPVSA